MSTIDNPAASHRECFTCTVERDEDGRVIAVAVHSTTIDGDERSTRINSGMATRVAGAVHDVLRSGGVTGRSWSSTPPITVDYLTGAQLELLLVAVKPLRRADRIDRISNGVAAMSREEASYWHAKLRRPGGLPALRLLLASGEHR